MHGETLNHELFVYMKCDAVQCRGYITTSRRNLLSQSSVDMASHFRRQSS